jgi:diadenylate cyclase
VAAETTVTVVVRAVEELSKQRIGALIAFERSASLRQFQQHGSELNAPLVWELLTTLFYPHTPMHDGGVVIRGSTIVAAGCVFPLATGQAERRSFGTRHRAAIGLSEETDALVVVVSEETGLVSVAYRGELTRGFDMAELRDVLTKTLVVPKSESRSRRRAKQGLPAGAAEAVSTREEGEDQVAAAIAAAKEDRE